MSSVTTSWPQKSLEQCLEMVIDYRGKSIPKSASGVQLITARNVRDGVVDLAHTEYIPTNVYSDWMDRGIPRSGDILFTTEAPLGMIAPYPQTGRFALGQRVVALRANEFDLHSGFLLQYLRSPDGQNSVVSLATGSTAIGIRQSELRKLKIPLPPLAEQRKIAAILGTWDTAIATAERLVAALRRRKQALMQRLLTGEVRFPGFAQVGKNKYLLGKEVPSDWKIMAFAEFVERDGRTFNPEKSKETLLCLELEHVTQETGQIISSTTTETQRSVKNRFSAGEVLFGKLRPNLKKFVQPNFDGVCSSEFWVLNGKAGLCLNDYVYYIVQSHPFVSAANASSGTKMPRADWSHVSEFAFAIPGVLEEQKKIVEVLRNQDEAILQLQRYVKRLILQKRGLMQRLLTGEVRVVGDVGEVI